MWTSTLPKKTLRESPDKNKKDKTKRFGIFLLFQGFTSWHSRELQLPHIVKRLVAAAATCCPLASTTTDNIGYD
jgi:hypothetical protein